MTKQMKRDARTCYPSAAAEVLGLPGTDESMKPGER